ncbi:glycosyltransferase family 2 protein [Azomonas macrocytogenes]|uniref:GT2 family glycosyltransferase n=1 Tax=Azomonas macrocytogenes TaxID=69962 RepID=A0A839T245_AZOMA|nr:glycosyltransferase family 2 protein [Azomonas macrocytogenes]MBB3102464.1 GT2 family glycosyltransferase [Azomonas macrocytogenes]
MLSTSLPESIRSADKALSLAALSLALQTPAYRNEALIWQGISFLKEGKAAEAFLALAKACENLPQRTDIKALLGLCLQKLAPGAITESYLHAALRAFPTEPNLRQQYWNNCRISCSPQRLNARIRAQLADIQDSKELKQVLQLLASDPATCQPVGVVHHDPVQNTVTGWAIDLQDPARTLNLQFSSGPNRGEFPASAPSPLLTRVGFPATHGGILIRLPQPLDSVHVCFAETGEQLVGSPLAALPPFITPTPSEQDPASQPVDILLPIYKGVEATLACLTSLLRSSRENRTPHRIIVLDDCSPEQELVNTVKELASQGKLDYIRRPANLGFIRNMNRGMALHPERDVLWLNADTLVQGDWLDRLRTVAYGADDIASVAPFSNNGELMSFPESRVCHPMPSPQRHTELDRVARQANQEPVELEVGCGFCLYIKRHTLNTVGYLDEVELKRGYGEETDWCLRARSKGWRHMGATNVFVAHAGGHSFGPEKALRVYQNNAILRRRYPDAERRFDTFVARDPLAPARQALARQLDEQPSIQATSTQTILQPLVSNAPELLGRCWLIADRLDHARIGERWLQLARHLIRQRQPITLLLSESSPWEKQLLTCRNVVRLPQIDGLSEMEILALSDTTLALSLDDTSPATGVHPRQALQLAQRYQLPLFAPQTSGFTRQGAFGLDALNFFIPEALIA